MKMINRLITYMLIVSLLFSLLATSVFASNVPALDDPDYDHADTDYNEESTEKVVEVIGNNTITIKKNASFEILEKSNSIEKVSKELFGNVEIKMSDYLFNLDGSFDYIYVEFSNGGYAIFMKDTMELLEYSPQDRIDYSEEQGKKFYGGPNQYYSKVDGKFINIVSGETLNISNAQIQAYSENVRTMLKTNYSKKMKNSSIQFDLSSIGKEENNEQRSVNENVGNVPSIDDYPLINNLPISDGTYITNYMYFLTDPTHGTNTTGTCGAVSAQLLLSYHNYYSDRRIIDNIYLNGSSNATERNLNPNYCEDPMSMTSQTLGTKGSAEDGSDTTNSYFAKVVAEIPKSAQISDVKQGIKNLLNENDNPYPTLSDHFNNSWKVDDSDDNNPWISAKGFDEYWRDRVAHQDFTTGQLLADDKPEGLYNFEVGDVIMVMENGIGTHAMIITRAPEDYRNEDEVLYLSGHTHFRMDESFRDILEDMNTNTVFRFYNFHDIKG